MSVYLVRSLLLSFFIGIFVTVCYYFLREDVNVSKLINLKKPPKTFEINFKVRALRSPLYEQQKAFSQAVQSNMQITEKRLRDAGFDSHLQVKNDSTYTISVDQVTDTNAVRDLVSGNTRLGFYEVYTLDEIVPVLTKLPIELFHNLKFTQPYQTDDGKPVYPPYIGICRVTDSASVNAFFADPEILFQFPANTQFLFGEPQTPGSSSDAMVEVYAIRKVPDPLSNKYISKASAEVSGQNESVLIFEFNAAGTARWENMTERNVGKPIALCLNERVITAPNVIQKITGGNSRLTMDRSLESCRILGVLLTSDDLLLPVQINETRINAHIFAPAEALSPVMRHILAFCASFIISFCIIWFIFRPGKKAAANP
jgi:preprotein translocase subunit SecD